MGVRHSVSYFKILATTWTAGAVKQGEGRVVAARRNSGYRSDLLTLYGVLIMACYK